MSDVFFPIRKCLTNKLDIDSEGQEEGSARGGMLLPFEQIQTILNEIKAPTLKYSSF